MTPHILLLTSAEEVGGPILVPLSSIDYAAPLGQTVRIFLHTGIYLDVTDGWDAIIRVLGGLVMQPNPNLGAAWQVR